MSRRKGRSPDYVTRVDLKSLWWAVEEASTNRGMLTSRGHEDALAEFDGKITRARQALKKVYAAAAEARVSRSLG